MLLLFQVNVESYNIISFVCSSHLCILSYMHVPYGAFFINKEFEFEFEYNVPFIVES
jgi:hypothetical protein